MLVTCVGCIGDSRKTAQEGWWQFYGNISNIFFYSSLTICLIDQYPIQSVELIYSICETIYARNTGTFNTEYHKINISYFPIFGWFPFFTEPAPGRFSLSYEMSKCLSPQFSLGLARAMLWYWNACTKSLFAPHWSINPINNWFSIAIDCTLKVVPIGFCSVRVIPLFRISLWLLRRSDKNMSCSGLRIFGDLGILEANIYTS